MENQFEIIPGDGITLYIGTDKYPYTIISYEKNILEIQQDKAFKNNNKYEILPNINGSIKFLKRYPKHHNFNNWFTVELNEETGEREYFIDPSF